MTKNKIIIIALVVLALVPVVYFLYPKIKKQIEGFMMEKTFAIIKPDAVKAKNSGKIIDLIEQNGFNIVKLEKITMTQEQAKTFYAVHKDKPFFQEVVDFMCSGPVIVMALEKSGAVDGWRTLMGSTNPEKADAGTIRKLFGTDIMKNATHGSDSAENAKIELEFFFPGVTK